MRRAALVAAVLLTWNLFGTACAPTTVVGSTCEAEHCADVPNCGASEQQFPETCDEEARVCHEVGVENDELLCESCFGMLDRLNIGSPLAPCACTYCALQLTACFASATTEPDGDAERDQLCRAMIECGWASGCEGSDCYCGKDVNRDTCLKNANDERSEGVCADVVQAAATCRRNEPPGSCVFGRQLDTNSAIGRATDVAKCVSGDPLLQGEVIVPRCR